MASSSDDWKTAIRATKRARGGRCQRDGADDPIPQHRRRCKLVEAWLEDYAFEDLSAAAVQRYASLLLGDGFEHPTVKDLAKLGANGKYPGNCAPELNTWLRSSFSRIVQRILENYISTRNRSKRGRLGYFLWDYRVERG